MRTINKAPLLRQGDKAPAVEDVQRLLNASDRAGTGHVWSKTDFLKEDGKFGPLTHAKVHEFQLRFGLRKDGIVGPETNAALFAPQADRVDQAHGIAQTWTLIAKGAVQALLEYVRTLQFNQPPPSGLQAHFVEALRVHFHIDLPDPPGKGNNQDDFENRRGSLNPLDLLAADERLRFIFQVFDDVNFVLQQASIREGRVFYSIGLKQAEQLKVGSISGAVRNVISSQGFTMLVVFPPSFHTSTDPEFFRTTSQQASTILHECCHYARPPNEGSLSVTDHAYGLPAFKGVPAQGKSKNYAQIDAEEALHNAESYNLFAEHATFGRDTRFGRLSNDLATFECGSLALHLHLQPR